MVKDNKFVIGICDDERGSRKEVRKLCDMYFAQNTECHEYVEFESGEDVLVYSEQIESRQIDLLFLDIEMKGMDGIQLMEQIVKNPTVRGIVFVTGHRDKVFEAFGQKTIGYILKPASYERVEKMLDIVRKEKQNNIEFVLKGYLGEDYLVLPEEIVYLKAAGSYTEIFTIDSTAEELKCRVISKRIGELERELEQFAIVRVHKSFLVCMENIVRMESSVTVKNTDFIIPIGRKYKDKVKSRYLKYISDKVRMRL